ncbi:MAG: PhnD/SsuA/transferrin family substrate-binding protein [Spirulinaceae cyanobacterium]
MKRRKFFWYSLLFLTSCSATVESPKISEEVTNQGSKEDTLRFTVTYIHQPEELEEKYGEFANTLTKIIDLPVELVLVGNHTEAASALQLAELDLVLAGASEYVIIASHTNAIPVVAITGSNNRSVIAVDVNSQITSIAQLKSKKIAMSSVGSTSGHLGPLELLLEAGIDPTKDLEILWLGSEGSREAIQEGTVDAWAGSTLDYEKLPQKFKLLAQGELLPDDVFIASSQLDPKLVKILRQRMLGNQQELIAAIAKTKNNQEYISSELTTVRDSDYDSIRKVYKAIGEDKFL